MTSSPMVMRRLGSAGGRGGRGGRGGPAGRRTRGGGAEPAVDLGALPVDLVVVDLAVDLVAG
ncbi:MAG: hypothetical protein JNL54_06395 [Kineosporiaceae bacterium]|nr:hypothetical protein [Kineosporiaceae bacterium]